MRLGSGVPSTRCRTVSDSDEMLVLRAMQPGREVAPRLPSLLKDSTADRDCRIGCGNQRLVGRTSGLRLVSGPEVRRGWVWVRKSRSVGIYSSQPAGSRVE